MRSIIPLMKPRGMQIGTRSSRGSREKNHNSFYKRDENDCMCNIEYRTMCTKMTTSNMHLWVVVGIACCKVKLSESCPFPPMFIVAINTSYHYPVPKTVHVGIRVITKLPNSEQSYKGKGKTHKYINRQNQSTTGKLWKP